MSCGICFNQIKNKSKLFCKHEFCTKCLIFSINQNKCCPKCNKTIHINDMRKITNNKKIIKSLVDSESNYNYINNVMVFLIDVFNDSKIEIKFRILNKLFKLYFKNKWLLKKNEDLKNIVLKKLYELKEDWDRAYYWEKKIKTI